ncbi:eukaryotic translation initiation factor 2-alpha kinase 3-like isoform X1 [Metopolophium dirhodum]|uniref:eukaryotic translation initiation factor 2-alpha kinase 3-like isoform X1 n=1 Tax=Metopolophium dirhodum TaxID=44670 RepID=UPI00298FB7A5|nr:eukaryotic translation initiation factor 2-alpha kinase 3-like isoform X1 [Metopolophium dirhodum]
MNIDQNENVAQKENDDHEKKKENVQPVQKQIDEFKSHYSQNFQTIHCLGKGGFGIVFKARNKLDDCNYAIKRIPFPPRQESRDRVLREVKALAELEHKNIVKYFNAWLEEPPRSWQEEQDKKWMPKSDCMDTSSNITTSPTDTTRDSHSERKATKQYLYIQMELCQKYSLRERLKTGTLHKNMMDILNIFFQIIEGVEYIHLQEFIHRDLKPSNIFFISDDQIKIGDFGSVTKMLIYDTWNEYDDKQKCLNEQHTNQVGTHLYMSPEQIHGKPYNLKVDIYSLGVIFFEMLNSFNTEMERCKTLQQVRNGTFPPQFLELYEFKTEKDMVCLMLSQDPKKRPTASNLKSMLLVYLDRFNLLMPDSCPF